MPYSVFELFKVGIGPSSSHTVGPMVAARSFIEAIDRLGVLVDVRRIEARLYGSLAFTGIGHGSDNAILLGLSGQNPHFIEPNQVAQIVANIDQTKAIKLGGTHSVPFNRESDLVFDYGKPLVGHSNGMWFMAFGGDGKAILDQVFLNLAD